LRREAPPRRRGLPASAFLTLTSQSHLQETDQRPEEAFGSPQEYAARFPKGNTVSPGTRVAYLTAFTLMAIIAVKVFTGQLLGISLGFPGTFIYLGRPPS
jgi:hypothetical protein